MPMLNLTVALACFTLTSALLNSRATPEERVNALHDKGLRRKKDHLVEKGHVSVFSRGGVEYESNEMKDEMRRSVTEKDWKDLRDAARQRGGDLAEKVGMVNFEDDDNDDTRDEQMTLDSARGEVEKGLAYIDKVLESVPAEETSSGRQDDTWFTGDAAGSISEKDDIRRRMERGKTEGGDRWASTQDVYDKDYDQSLALKKKGRDQPWNPLAFPGREWWSSSIPRPRPKDHGSNYLVAPPKTMMPLRPSSNRNTKMPGQYQTYPWDLEKALETPMYEYTGESDVELNTDAKDENYVAGQGQMQKFNNNVGARYETFKAFKELAQKDAKHAAAYVQKWDTDQRRANLLSSIRHASKGGEWKAVSDAEEELKQRLNAWEDESQEDGNQIDERQIDAVAESSDAAARLTQHLNDMEDANIDEDEQQTVDNLGIWEEQNAGRMEVGEDGLVRNRDDKTETIRAATFNVLLDKFAIKHKQPEGFIEDPNTGEFVTNWAARWDKMQASLRKWDFDVVFLQELDTKECEGRMATDLQDVYKTFCHKHQGRDDGVGIMVRQSWCASGGCTADHVDGSTKKSFARVRVVRRLAADDGDTLDISLMSVHQEHTYWSETSFDNYADLDKLVAEEASREKSAEKARRVIIFGGDMNADWTNAKNEPLKHKDGRAVFQVPASWQFRARSEDLPESMTPTNTKGVKKHLSNAGETKEAQIDWVVATVGADDTSASTQLSLSRSEATQDALKDFYNTKYPGLGYGPNDLWPTDHALEAVDVHLT